MIDSGPEDASGVGAEAMIKASLFVNAMLTGACNPAVEPHLLKGAAEKTTDPGSDPAKTVAKSVPGFGDVERAVAETPAGNELAQASPRRPAQPETATKAAMMKARCNGNPAFNMRVLELGRIDRNDLLVVIIAQPDRAVLSDGNRENLS